MSLGYKSSDKMEKKMDSVIEIRRRRRRRRRRND
jgi:hypothetical protein